MDRRLKQKRPTQKTGHVLNQCKTKSVKEIKDIISKKSRISNNNESNCLKDAREVKTSEKKMQDPLQKSDEQWCIDMTEIHKDMKAV